MHFKIHEDKHFTGFYDPVKYLIYVQYQESITSQITDEVYTWMHATLENIDQLRGAIFDFQLVKRFDQTNYTTAQRQSTQLNTNFDLRTIPTALLVDSIYQEMTLHTQLSMSPQQERKKMVKNLEDAMAFITEFNQQQGIEASNNSETLTILNTMGASEWYDEGKHTVMVIYYGSVTGDTTAAVYTTTNHILAQHGVENIQGAIYDFRCISGFQLENYRTVRSESSNLNQTYDMSHIAVSLIVRNIVQEQLVRSTLRLTPQERRKRIVHSTKEGRKFIQTYQPTD